MMKFFDACAKAALAAWRALRAAARLSLTWLSVPFNAVLAAIGLAFLVSFLAWAVGDRNAEVALFFPSARTGALRGELRDLPRKWGREGRAELLASELLPGPRSDELSPAFPQGTKVEAVLYRKGRLYLDLSAEAALSPPSELRAGLAAMRRTMERGFPWLKELVLTIGGREPYSLGYEAGNGAKNQKDN